MKPSVIISVVLLLVASTAHASLVVASKDSPGKHRADFVCDGIDDQVEIQKAIDSLPSTGGMVELLEGVFNFSDDVEITKSNVTIRGTGLPTVLTHNPTTLIKLTKDGERGAKTITVADTSQFHVGHLIGVTDEVLQKWPAPKYYYDSPPFIACDFYIVRDISRNTITLDRGLDISVSVGKNARVAPVWAMIRAYGKTNLELSDFQIDCNWDNVAWLIGVGKKSKYSHHPGPEIVRPKDYKCPFPQIVEKVHHPDEPISAIYMDSAHNSKFRNLYLHDIPMNGIFLIESNYILVQGNTIRDFGMKGYVDCYGDYTQVIGNVIENSVKEDGINVYAPGSAYAIVSNNIVRNCPRACIIANGGKGIVVTGNNVYGSGTNPTWGVGIALVTQDAVAVGNYVEGTTIGMVLEWATLVDDHPMTAVGNVIKDCVRGFHVSGANHVNLVGNSVAHTRGGGGVVSTHSDGSSRLIISNNQFLSSSAGDPAMWLSGDNHFIFGNKIRGFKTGVRLESTVEGSIIERNEFIDVPETIVDEGKGNIEVKNR